MNKFMIIGRASPHNCWPCALAAFYRWRLAPSQYRIRAAPSLEFLDSESAIKVALLSVTPTKGEIYTPKIPT